MVSNLYYSSLESKVRKFNKERGKDLVNQLIHLEKVNANKNQEDYDSKAADKLARVYAKALQSNNLKTELRTTFGNAPDQTTATDANIANLIKLAKKGPTTLQKLQGIDNTVYTGFGPIRQPTSGYPDVLPEGIPVTPNNNPVFNKYGNSGILSPTSTGDINNVMTEFPLKKTNDNRQAMIKDLMANFPLKKTNDQIDSRINSELIQLKNREEVTPSFFEELKNRIKIPNLKRTTDNIRVDRPPTAKEAQALLMKNELVGAIAKLNAAREAKEANTSFGLTKNAIDLARDSDKRDRRDITDILNDIVTTIEDSAPLVSDTLIEPQSTGFVMPDSELRRLNITAMKEVAKKEGVSGYGNFTKSTKDQLATLILTNRIDQSNKKKMSGKGLPMYYRRRR